MASAPVHFEFGGYRVLEVLVEDRTYLAEAPGGRRVVLKMLDGECLLDRRLHPSIRERLARVRELAEKGVANLHGVERDAGKTYAVWDFVAGEALSQQDMLGGLSQRQFLEMARELVLTVQSLHGSGIVHGAIRPGNIVLSPSRSLRLTHISPLLFDDPRQDAEAVLAMLCELAARRRETELPLGRMLAEARAQNLGLRQLATRLSSLEEPRETPVARRSGESQETRVRRRALWSAAAVTLAAAAIAGSLWWSVGSGRFTAHGDELPAVELNARQAQEAAP
jgi:serine/threonine protein kinase